MKLIKGDTFADAYRQSLEEIYLRPEHVVKPRGQWVKEVRDLALEIADPCANLLRNEVRSTPAKYLAGELFWYFTGDNSLAFIERYSKFWTRIANPDGTVNSAYGHLLFKEPTGPTPEHFSNQWAWARHALESDKDTRQAILHFNKPHHQRLDVKDFVCTLVGNFHIREEKLYLTVVMRSQDEIKGRIFDVPFFTLLQQQMRRQLLTAYPYLQLGSYTQVNLSSHIYERDFGLVREMLTRPFDADGLPPLVDSLLEWDGRPSDALLQAAQPGGVAPADGLLRWIWEHL